VKKSETLAKKNFKVGKKIAIFGKRISKFEKRVKHFEKRVIKLEKGVFPDAEMTVIIIATVDNRLELRLISYYFNKFPTRCVSMHVDLLIFRFSFENAFTMQHFRAGSAIG